MQGHSWNSAVARQLQSPQLENDVYRRRQEKSLTKSFPVGEKMLYLFSVILCVFFTLIVISKHAKVTEINLNIRSTERNIQEVNKLNLQLQMKKEQLSSIESIRTFAEKKGLELSLPKILPS